MVVRLIFDSRISYVYVPDGYITDAKSLRCPFIEWVYDNPNCVEKTKKHMYVLVKICVSKESYR